MLMFYFTNPEIVKQEDMEHEILNAMEQLLAKEHQE